MPLEPDPESLERLLANGNWVRRLARRLLYDDSLTEDVVQEVWITALQRPPSKPQALQAWLKTVVRTLALRANRSMLRRQRRESQASLPAPPPSADEIQIRLETQSRLTGMVLDLAEPYRSVIYLHFFEDLKLVDIAARLGCADSTVRNQLARGLEKLRERLGREHGGRQRWRALLLPLVLPPALLDGAAGAGAAAPLPAAIPAGAVPRAARLLLALGALALAGAMAMELMPGAGAPDDASRDGPRAVASAAPPAAPDIGGAAAIAVTSLPPPAAAPSEPAAASASIRVIDARTRAAVEGAQVYWAPIERRDPSPLGRTGADGALELEASILEREALLVHAAGYVECREAAALRDLAAGPFVIELEPVFAALVRVVLPDGGPAAGASITVRERPRIGGAEESALRAGADGEAVFAYRFPDTVIRVTLEGFAAVSRAAAAPETRVELRPGRRFEGRVLDAAGQPAAGCAVRLESLSLSEPVDVESDAAGRFDVGWVDPDETMSFTFYPQGLPAARISGRPPAGGEWRFTLPEGVFVRGRASAPGGAPPAGGYAFIVVPRAGPDDRRDGPAARVNARGLPERGRGERRLHPILRAPLDAEGRFELGPLPADAAPCYLLVHHPRFARYLERLDPVDGDARRAVSLSRGRSVAGRLRAPDGGPIAGALLHFGEIWSNGLESVLGRARSGADGGFRFDGLPEGDDEALRGDVHPSGEAVRRRFLFVAAFPPDELIELDGEGIEASPLWSAFPIDGQVRRGAPLDLIGAKRSQLTAVQLALRDPEGAPVRGWTRVLLLSGESGLHAGAIGASRPGARLFSDQALKLDRLPRATMLLLPEGFRWLQVEDLDLRSDGILEERLAPLPASPSRLFLRGAGGAPAAGREALAGVPFHAEASVAAISLGRSAADGGIDAIGHLPPGRHRIFLPPAGRPPAAIGSPALLRDLDGASSVEIVVSGEEERIEVAVDEDEE